MTYKMTKAHKEAISKANYGHLVSSKTRQKIGLANRKRIKCNCAFCKSIIFVQPSKAKLYRRQFCNIKCYAAYRKEIMPPNEQPTWRGGVSNAESHRRWKRKNPERMAFLKARRYARKKGAVGNHTFEEWQSLKKKYKFCCVICGKREKLTKDHIIALSNGGSDYISNIQPLCRNCNSQKWKF